MRKKKSLSAKGDSVGDPLFCYGRRYRSSATITLTTQRKEPNMIDQKYVDFAVEKTLELLAIDSP
ncbi:MAG: hypothetical protein IJH54_08345, partial [Clostridia bacterium]|nr:hypothetical protein [Clostridia bacterium]